MTPPPSTYTASYGDIVTIDLEMIPENDYVPEGLFDTTGRITFVLGGGNYVPALHELVVGCSINDSVSNVSIDAGFGHYQQDLIIEVPLPNLLQNVLNPEVKKRRKVHKVGQILYLKGGFQVTVLKILDDSVVVDANHPLAGSSYSCSFRLIRIDPNPTSSSSSSVEEDDDVNANQLESSQSSSSSSSFYQVATVAAGCFWGIELALMRLPGVVGTRAGYTQGHVVNPTYEQVCEGNTNHREAIQIIYDTRICSYQTILELYFERLAATLITPYARDGGKNQNNDNQQPTSSSSTSSSVQYQHGIYYHNDKQHELAKHHMESNDLDSKYNVELMPAAPFYDAEDRHQQYLYKGGQSARKGARDIIRCYG